MARYQVVLVYDGTEFRGFQRQTGARTVQGEIEAALQKIGWAGRAILAAGRTDAGVHAAGQVIAFDLEWAHSTEDLLNALNAYLPADVAAQEAAVTRTGFHPRYDALARRYRYLIFCQPRPDPLRERYAWRVWPAASLSVMQAAAEALPGSHDFAAFGTPPRPGGSTIRQVSLAQWQPDGQNLVFEIVGNAFLYRMVRRLVNTMVESGQGRLAPEIVGDLLERPPATMIQGLAPPQGLTLMEVVYPS